MDIVSFLEKYVLPNLYGSVGVSILWVANAIKNKRSEKIKDESYIVENAKKIIEMSETMVNRFEGQSQKVEVKLERTSRLLEEMTSKYNNCQDQLRIAGLVRIDMEQTIKIRDEEIEFVKSQCILFKKILTNEKCIINDECSGGSIG